MTIYVSGSLAYDRIMDFPGHFSDHILPEKIHILNVCFTVNGMKENFGGTAGNIAYTLRLLGERSLILATIGQDNARYFEWLKKCDIPTEGIRIVEDEFTAGAYITTDRADNQITGFNPGSMKHQSRFPFPAGKQQAIAIIAPGNLDDMRGYADYYRSAGIPFLCDPGQSLTAWNPDDLKHWIQGSAMLITNDYELELVCKMTGKDKEGLLGMTGMIITTLGEKGSVIVSKEGEVVLPVAPVGEVVDPTGAGDAYRAGLLKGLVAGRDVMTAAKMGAVAATYAIERYGTQEHAFTPAEFAARYRAGFGEAL
jgi:adenosine kinase